MSLSFNDFNLSKEPPAKPSGSAVITGNYSFGDEFILKTDIDEFKRGESFILSEDKNVETFVECGIGLGKVFFENKNSVVCFTGSTKKIEELFSKVVKEEILF